MSVAFPFSAVVGQDDLRLALLLNAVSPAVGGVLVRGEKGTAKTTTVRALAALLPAVPVVRRKVSVVGVGRMVSVIRLIGDCRYDGMNSK